jgi:hypothetical protein
VIFARGAPGTTRKQHIVCLCVYPLLVRTCRFKTFILLPKREAGSRGSLVSMVTELRAVRPGFDSRQGFFFLASTSRPALGDYPACYEMETGGLFPRDEADRFLQLARRFRMCGVIPPLPTLFMAWCLIKQ